MGQIMGLHAEGAEMSSEQPKRYIHPETGIEVTPELAIVALGIISKDLAEDGEREKASLLHIVAEMLKDLKQ